MPNAVALDRFAGLPPRPEDGVVAVFSGALRPWHGIEAIAEAWRLLGAAAPRLLVVGDGPGRQLMEEIGADVTGAVPHDDVPALLASAHIGLAPYPQTRRPTSRPSSCSSTSRPDWRSWPRTSRASGTSSATAALR